VAPGAPGEGEAESTEHEPGQVLVAKGLVEPKRPSQLQYSAPTVDGEGGIETHADGGSASGATPATTAESGNRAQRRATKKRRG
jgi:preprotein translocase subunit SecA